MSTRFEATPTIVADAIGKHIDGAIRDAIRDRLMVVAAEVVEEAVREVVGRMVGKVESWHECRGGITVAISINGVVLPGTPTGKVTQL